MNHSNRRSIGLLSAIFLNVSSIIGSSWLFAPYKAAVIAGPASILAWIIGAGLVILLALCLAEIAALYPRRGLSAIIPTLSHDKFFGFPFAIANWLGIVAVIGLEADATIEYLINLLPNLQHILYHNYELTKLGNSLSISLVIVYCLLNYWGVQVLTRVNNIFAILKLLILFVAALIIIAIAFHPKNFVQINSSFFPYGIQSIFTAIVSSGVVIAFNGFQSVVSFSGEIKRPHKTIPQALIISIVFCLGLYLFLSIAFIGAIPSQKLSAGWEALKMSAPMIEISLFLGSWFLTSIIYFGATIAPSGTAITFVGSSTRMFTAMAHHGQMPAYFTYTHPVSGVSHRSLIANISLAILFLLIFRSWGQLANFLSLLHIISYFPIPIALCVFRKVLKKYNFIFKLRAGVAISWFLFVVFSYIFTMGSLNAVTIIFILLIIFQLIFIGLNIHSWQEFMRALQKCSILTIYFSGLWILTIFSPANNPHLLRQPLFAILVALFSIIIFYFLIRHDHIDKELICAAIESYHP